MIAALSFLFMGIILGLLGGGGAILTVPILVYLLKVPTASATLLSLLIVGTSALLGAFFDRKNISIKNVLVFSIPSTIAVVLTRKLLLPIIPEQLSLFSLNLPKNSFLLFLFASLMIFIALKTLNTSKPSQVKIDKKSTGVVKAGIIVGFLAGLLGAGGGFLIVPALNLGLGLPLSIAISHSQGIIAIQSLVGGLLSSKGELSSYVDLLMLSISMSIFGVILGKLLSKKIPAAALKNIFAFFILIMGIAIFLIESLAI